VHIEFTMPLQHPCQYPKHSFAQLECLRLRAERSEPLFHPQDSRQVIVEQAELWKVLEKIRLVAECQSAEREAERRREKRKLDTQKKIDNNRER